MGQSLAGSNGGCTPSRLVAPYVQHLEHYSGTHVPRAPTTLLYMGSDVDVSIVHRLAAWESRVVMIDEMTVASMPEFDHAFAAYDAKHVDDQRAAFRNSTRSIRMQCEQETGKEQSSSPSRAGCSAATLRSIGDLLEARLRLQEHVHR